MNKFIVYIILQLLVFGVKAQNKFAIYGNAGIPINTNFEFKPNQTAYGDFGLRYYFYKGLSISLEANDVVFKQRTDLNKFVANYYTQTFSLGTVLMNETKISNHAYIGIGVGASLGYFYGRVFAQDKPAYFLITGASNTRFNEIYPTFKGQILYKHHINRFLDAQIGLSYHYAQSYFLDMYTDITKKDYDNYTQLFVGCVIKFGKLNFHGKGIKSSRKIKCPSF